MNVVYYFIFVCSVLLFSSWWVVVCWSCCGVLLVGVLSSWVRSVDFCVFYIIDERGGKLELIQRQVEKAWKSLGSRLFILDPLSDILRHLPNDDQDQIS